MRPVPLVQSLAVAAACAAADADALGAAARSAPSRRPRPPPPLSFNRDIRPILSNNCFACHGPDEKQRETKFHFDTREGMFLEDGVIVPGSAAKSLLVKKITEPNPEDRMPPPDSGHALTDKQIALLKRWIDEGAKWDSHWAFTAPVRTEPPAAKAAGWARNPIDQFILARLEREGLRALARSRQGHAAPPRHLRPDRAAADAGGDRRLPRRPVARRLREARRRAARVAALRRAHGDAVARRGALRRHARLSHRQPARHVALARLGHQRLQPQPAVRSVRRSSSWPAICCRTRRVEQKIASGFNRNHMINFEGGAIAEEYQVEYVDRSRRSDLVDVHGPDDGVRAVPYAQVRSDHAQGVLPVLRVLQLRARARPRRPHRQRRAVLPLPSPAQQAQLDELNAAISVARRGARRQASSRRCSRRGKTRFADTVAPIDGNAPGGALRARRQLLGHLRPLSARPHRRRRADVRRRPDRPRARRSTATPRSASATSARSSATEPFSLAVWLRGRGNLPMAAFQKLDGADKRRGYEWLFDDIVLVDIQRWAARLTIRLRRRHARRQPSDPHARAADARRLVSRALTYDGSGKAAGLRLYLNGRELERRSRARRAGRIDPERRAAHASAARRSARRSAASSTTCASTTARSRRARSSSWRSTTARAPSSRASPASGRRTKRSTCATTS